MSISRIMDLLPVPPKPVESDGHDWPLIFKQLGVKDLPSDYKAFVSTYGTGSIGDFLWIMNPFSENPYLNLEMMMSSREAYEAMKQDFPDDYPRESNSLLTWAVTDNGDDIVWFLDDENSDLWQVGFQGRNVLDDGLTGLTTSEFLVLLLENKMESRILPDEFLTTDMRFKPV